MKDRINSRLKIEGRSARDVSIAATGKADTIRNILRGATQNPKADTLRAIASELGTSIEWLLGEGEEDFSAHPRAAALGGHDTESGMRNIPVRGTAAGRLLKGEFFLRDAAVDMVWRPPSLANARNAYAFYVVGTSMEPEFRQGELYFAHPDRPAKAGDPVIVLAQVGENGSVEATLGRLVEYSQGKVNIAKHNPKSNVEFNARTIIRVDKVLTNNELFSG